MVCSMADGTCLLIAWLAASQLASSGLDTGELVGGRGNGLSLMRAATSQHSPDSEHRPRGADRRSASTQPSDEDEDEENEHACDVDEFFNIREANANMDKGSWAIELPVGWATRSNHHRDEVTAGALLNYGLTNDAYVALEAGPLTLGQGGDQGNGDLNLILFQQLLHEAAQRPALAIWGEMRIPSGQGSSGVDATFHLNATKSFSHGLRTHAEIFVETANGGSSPQERENRRALQWGAGPGFDYALDSQTLVILNYLNRSSEERGHHNQNILEFGFCRALGESQQIKLAVDVGLDGQRETPNIAVRFEWELDWN